MVALECNQLCTVKIELKIIGAHFTRKNQFQSYFVKVLHLIQCVAIVVIICEIKSEFIYIYVLFCLKY